MAEEKNTEREPVVRLAIENACASQCVSSTLVKDRAEIATCATIAPRYLI